MKFRYTTTPFTDRQGRFIKRPLLLGQADFFERFRVKFEKDRDMFELSPSPKAKR